MAEKLTEDTCPDRRLHTAEPTEPAGYTAWHEWAAWMAQRSRQKQCPTCGLWVIWSPTGEELGYKSDTICCIRMGRLWRGKKASA